MKDDIKAAIAEALDAMRNAIQEGYHDAAHTYSVIIERLQILLREI